MDKLLNSKPRTMVEDPDHADTQNSIKVAEGTVGESLRDPNLHKESWWYFDLDAKMNEGLDPGEKVDRGPIYRYSEKHDSDIDGTLKSAKLAEDFYGVRHPNRFTGEFSDDGAHLVNGEEAGKGKYQGHWAHASLTGGYGGAGYGGQV